MNTSPFGRCGRGPLPRAVLLVVLASFGTTEVASAAPEWRLRRVAARAPSAAAVLEPLAADGLRPADRAFLEQAADGSRRQIRFAELGASRATGSEVRRYLTQVISEQRRLAESLDALIRRKGASVRAAADDANTTETYERLIQRAGADFDRSLVLVMAAQQEDLMQLFEHAAADAKDDDVRTFAAAQLPSLRAQRNAVTNLKKALE